MQPFIGEGKMKTCRWLLLFPGFVLVFMMAATAADAPTLTFKFTKYNVPGASATGIGGINNSGVIVGEYEDTKSVQHCFMLSGGKVTTINYPKAASDSCIHINSKGAIVGASKNTAGVTKGFVYQNGKFTDVPGPSGARSAVAYGINDSGVVVGTYTDAKDELHGFELKGKTYKILDPPGSILTIATGINNAGNVVMFYGKSGALESALYNGKTYKTINVPGAANSFAFDINTAGDIVYETLNSSGTKAQAVLFQAGKFYTFGYPKSADSSATGINDKSEVVGYYQTKTISGPDQGFTATY
jgi:probable HAF family extracellular repeat protein